MYFERGKNMIKDNEDIKKRIIDRTYLLRTKGDYEYILSKYIDGNIWEKKIKKSFPNLEIDNLTDFNYSTCFTLYINIPNTNLKVGTAEFIEYIKKLFFV